MTTPPNSVQAPSQARPKPIPQLLPRRPEENPWRRKAQQAARASWATPLVVAGMNALAIRLDIVAKPANAQILLIVGLGLYVLGLMIGLRALRDVPRYGPAGIRMPALVGITFNAALFVVLAGYYWLRSQV